VELTEEPMLKKKREGKGGVGMMIRGHKRFNLSRKNVCVGGGTVWVTVIIAVKVKALTS
jgi:hypothetical protein